MAHRLFFILLLCVAGCARHDLKVSTFEVQKIAKKVEESQDVTVVIQNAIKDQNIKILEDLFSKMDVNSVLVEGKRPLELAIELERIKAIRFLRRIGANNQIVRIDSLSLTDWIATLPESKKSLIRAAVGDFSQEASELEMLLQGNNFKKVKSFLDEGIDVNVVFISKETPLTAALKQKALMSLRALLMIQDLDVNFKNHYQESPLGIAKKLNLKQIISELEKRGARDE